MQNEFSIRSRAIDFNEADATWYLIVKPIEQRIGKVALKTTFYIEQKVYDENAKFLCKIILNGKEFLKDFNFF
jgi:hypothetical protein